MGQRRPEARGPRGVCRSRSPRPCTRGQAASQRVHKQVWPHWNFNKEEFIKLDLLTLEFEFYKRLCVTKILFYYPVTFSNHYKNVKTLLSLGPLLSVWTVTC